MKEIIIKYNIEEPLDVSDVVDALRVNRYKAIISEIKQLVSDLYNNNRHQSRDVKEEEYDIVDYIRKQVFDICQDYLMDD